MTVHSGVHSAADRITAMSILSALPLEAKTGAGAAPFVIAGLALVLMFGAMLVLLAIGKGREHS